MNDFEGPCRIAAAIFTAMLEVSVRVGIRLKSYLSGSELPKGAWINSRSTMGISQSSFPPPFLLIPIDLLEMRCLRHDLLCQ